MSLERFTRRERKVRLGGQSFGIGPFRVHFGGGWYTVGPLSVLRVYQLHRAQAQAGAVLGALSNLAASLAGVPVGLIRALAPLFVVEDVAPKHLARMSGEQVAALGSAVAAVTDLAYIERVLSPRKGKGRGSTFDEWVVAASRVLGRPVEDLVRLPFEQVAWNIDLLSRLDDDHKPIEQRRPRELDPEEVAELNAKLAPFGVEIANG